MRFINKVIYIVTLCLLVFCLAMNCFAADGKQTAELLENQNGRVVSVAHRGDTVNFPANSLQAVESASSMGADAVSVCISETKDGVYVLCEDISLGNVCACDYESVSEITFEQLQKCFLYDSYGELTEYSVISLAEALEGLDGSVYLILDVQWEDMDGVYEILNEYEAFEYTSLRVKASATEITEWAENKPQSVSVIGIYTGNIIWSSISYINKLSEAGMSAVQYHTKNYFNVCYGSLVYSEFSKDGNARAVAAAYDADLCGQRSDSETGWDELIQYGYTVIETNNIKALVSYIERSTQATADLAELVKEAKAIDTGRYSSVSVENLTDAIENGEEVLEGRVKSLAEIQQAYSDLVFSMSEMRISDGHEDTKGALNITAGKIVAVVLIGSALFAGQVFVQKMHRKREN